MINWLAPTSVFLVGWCPVTSNSWWKIRTEVVSAGLAPYEQDETRAVYARVETETNSTKSVQGLSRMGLSEVVKSMEILIERTYRHLQCLQQFFDEWASGGSSGRTQRSDLRLPEVDHLRNRGLISQILNSHVSRKDTNKPPKARLMPCLTDIT